MKLSADEIGALLFRIQDAYPHAAMRPGTLDEWRASTALGGFNADVVFAAFDLWRDENDRPPAVASLVGYCQRVARQRASERGLSAPPDDPDNRPMTNAERKAAAQEAQRILAEARKKHT